MPLVAILVTIIITVVTFIRRRLSSRGDTREGPVERVRHKWQYDKLRTMIHDAGISLPAMIVDVDILDANIERLANMTRLAGKTMRIATKSIHCPEFIQRVLDKGQGAFKGLMCFSVAEAQMLSNYCKTMDDFYIPYPTVQKSDVSLAMEMCRSNKKITLTVDCIEQVQLLDTLCQEVKDNPGTDFGDTKLRVAIDIDMATKILGLITLGPHRSRCNSIKKFAEVANMIKTSSNLTLVGAMGYEAHVAGLTDDNPYAPVPNSIIRLLKRIFWQRSIQLRAEITKYCLRNQIILEFFNGGGSGNIEDACKDAAITEVTAGSAFLQAKMFDYYVQNQCSPAFCFALQCTRIKTDFICCQSGGFVASGSSSQDKFPSPFANPIDLMHYKDEGYGEVQTPLRVIEKHADAVGLRLGDPVFFRPAKSGEIAEHFNEYIIKRDYNIIGKACTYRGFGSCFY